MQFKFKVQYLGHTQNNNLHCYDFLSLDYNLPFTIYSLQENLIYNKYEQYHNYDSTFDLALVKDKQKGIIFKVRGVDNVK